METILITYGSWINSPFSIARHFGGATINGKEFLLISEANCTSTPDLLRKDWVPVYKALGRKKTIGLIKNGTSLKIAKEMIKAKKEELPKLFEL